MNWNSLVKENQEITSSQSPEKVSLKICSYETVSWVQMRNYRVKERDEEDAKR